MKLEEIGFYTLTDKRARNASQYSQLKRCELIITDRCNFKCPYCRGLRDDIKGTLPLNKIKSIIDIWANYKLENVRFSGGEPTSHPDIVDIISYAKLNNIKRIAISTNGSADMKLYNELIQRGVNDFSISLDACCAAYGDKMAGGINGVWEKLTDNIREISKLAYVSVGVVLTEETINTMNSIVEFADSLGVKDIRIIPSAQFDKFLDIINIKPEILNKYPILKYRVDNIKNNRHVRGLKECDTNKCPLVLDDMAVAGKFHFPCIIYMREQGNPIGEIGPYVRQERYEWFIKHNTHKDNICKKNCLDVCIDYNNRWINYSKEENSDEK